MADSGISCTNLGDCACDFCCPPDPEPPRGSCLACGYDEPWVIWQVNAGEATTGLCATCKRGADEARATL